MSFFKTYFLHFICNIFAFCAQHYTWQGAYYLGNDGVMYTNTFTPDGYYVGSDGAYLKNRWIGDYYLNGSGIKVTNAWVGNYWCGSDGKYVKSSWVDHNRYYVDSNGLYVAKALK